MIRNREGLYSSGGSTPHFSGIGKAWKSIGPVKSHLSLVRGYGKIPSDWDVIMFTLSEMRSLPAGEMYEDYYIKKQKREVVRQENERKNFLKKEIVKMQNELKNL